MANDGRFIGLRLANIKLRITRNSISDDPVVYGPNSGVTSATLAPVKIVGAAGPADKPWATRLAIEYEQQGTERIDSGYGGVGGPGVVCRTVEHSVGLGEQALGALGAVTGLLHAARYDGSHDLDAGSGMGKIRNGLDG